MVKVARLAWYGVLAAAALVMVADLTTRIAYSQAAVALRVEAVTRRALIRPIASEPPQRRTPRGRQC